jgi:hypothetical protein
MPLDPVVNFFRSQIATLPLASGGVTMVITTGDGNKLPNPATDGAFNLVIYNANDPFVTPEIVRVTAKSGDSLTITRAQEGTTATNKTAGNTWFVELVNTAKMIQNIDTNKVEKTGDTMTGTLTATKLIPSGNVTAGNGMYLPAANEVAISTNGTERLRINSTGAVTAGGTVTSGKFVPTANTTAGNGMYLPTTNQVAIGTDGTEAIRVNASQNTGVKTTTPRSALDVNGDVHIVSSKIIQKTVTCTDATATNVITVTPTGADEKHVVEIYVQANSSRTVSAAKYIFSYILRTSQVVTDLNAILAPEFITQNNSLENYSSIVVTVETTSGDGRAVAFNFTSGGGSSPFNTTARIYATVMGTNLANVT